MKQGNSRLAKLVPYPFAQLNNARDEAISKGIDVIDLGVGNPDLRPSARIIEYFKQELDNQSVQNHRYPPFQGIPEFRQAIARWYKNRFEVELDAEKEVLPLIGSKEGIAKFLLSHLDPGEIALIVSPCYPAYLGAARISDGTLFELPLLEQNGFRPDLKAIPEDIAKKTAIILINYPHNPTGATETRELYEELFEFADRYDLIIMSDIAYVELSLDSDYKPMSFLEIPGAKERCIEFYSFSKTYSMAGWRLGTAAGNARLLQNLLKIKTNMDFGVFMAMQRTGARILDTGDELIAPTRRIYAGRRDVVIKGLENSALRAIRPRATLYVWAAIPKDFRSSAEFCNQLLEKTGVVLAPGSGFGKYGEGYVRISLIDSEQRLEEAIDRIRNSGLL